MGKMAALGRVSAGFVRLSVDALGRGCPVGHAVMNPGAAAPVAVRLIATAATPTDGIPASPVSARDIVWFAPTNPDGRVSNSRVGLTGMNNPVAATGWVASVNQPKTSAMRCTPVSVNNV